MSTKIGAKLELADGLTVYNGTLDLAPLLTVQPTAPTGYLTPLVFNSTASTGGLYVWDGAAYRKVGLATS